MRSRDRATQKSRDGRGHHGGIRKPDRLTALRAAKDGCHLTDLEASHLLEALDHAAALGACPECHEAREKLEAARKRFATAARAAR